MVSVYVLPKMSKLCDLESTVTDLQGDLGRHTVQSCHTYPSPHLSLSSYLHSPYLVSHFAFGLPYPFLALSARPLLLGTSKQGSDGRSHVLSLCRYWCVSPHCEAGRSPSIGCCNCFAFSLTATHHILASSYAFSFNQNFTFLTWQPTTLVFLLCCNSLYFLLYMIAK